MRVPAPESRPKINPLFDSIFKKVDQDIHKRVKADRTILEDLDLDREVFNMEKTPYKVRVSMLHDLENSASR